MLVICLENPEDWDLAGSDPDSETGGQRNQFDPWDVFGCESGVGYDRTVDLTLIRLLRRPSRAPVAARSG